MLKPDYVIYMTQVWYYMHTKMYEVFDPKANWAAHMHKLNNIGVDTTPTFSHLEPKTRSASGITYAAAVITNLTVLMTLTKGGTKSLTASNDGQQEFIVKVDWNKQKFSSKTYHSVQNFMKTF